MKHTLYLFAFISMVVLAACGDDDSGTTCDTTDITYTNSIEKIISDAGCAQSDCHNSGSPQGSLANYDDAIIFVAFGRILGALNRENGFSQMPRDPVTGDAADKLADCDIDKIEAWINAGTPE